MSAANIKIKSDALKTAKALAEKENEFLKTSENHEEKLDYAIKALDEISLMVSYINTQTVVANLTNACNGPKAIMPLPQEAWDILMAVGKKAHEALSLLQKGNDDE